MVQQKSLNAREASLLALTSVEEDGSFVNLALANVLSSHQMDPRDKRLASEITYGVVTYRLTLDWLITQITGRPAQKLDRPVLYVLRIGFYQLFYLDRVPAPAIVHSTVELIKKGKKRALAPFVNGVMRGLLRKKGTIKWPDRQLDLVAYLSLHYAHPAWLVDRWLTRLGEQETERLLAANNMRPSVTIRTNTLRTSRTELLTQLTEEGLTVAPSEVAPDGIVLTNAGQLTGYLTYRSGLFQVQGESAMLTSRVLQPAPGTKVLDACSAPGGKTTHLAQLMNNQGDIIALDIHDHRLALVRANAKRLGIDIIRTERLDARELSPEHFGLFDHILLDVPCSGLGVIRRKPDVKWRREEADIMALASIQQAMITTAATVLKSGGTLVYSTCTNEPEETEDIITAFLSLHPDFSLVSLTPYLPSAWQADVQTHSIQLYPHIHLVDGFFIAKLQKA
ncbi:MAG: 16S rRNA (cytosine(967)-C(5))-methyltransferase RsmB [Firmicutes bacterium]|nr:16S rRNA (cytosine(967)-C(5))-methyltransferase RsmB [Bacillota bacterium]